MLKLTIGTTVKTVAYPELCEVEPNKDTYTVCDYSATKSGTNIVSLTKVLYDIKSIKKVETSAGTVDLTTLSGDSLKAAITTAVEVAHTDAKKAAEEAKNKISIYFNLCNSYSGCSGTIYKLSGITKGKSMNEILSSSPDVVTFLNGRISYANEASVATPEVVAYISDASSVNAVLGPSFSVDTSGRNTVTDDTSNIKIEAVSIQSTTDFGSASGVKAIAGAVESTTSLVPADGSIVIYYGNTTRNN